MINTNTVIQPIKHFFAATWSFTKSCLWYVFYPQIFIYSVLQFYWFGLREPFEKYANKRLNNQSTWLINLGVFLGMIEWSATDNRYVAIQYKPVAPEANYPHIFFFYNPQSMEIKELYLGRYIDTYIEWLNYVGKPKGVVNVNYFNRKTVSDQNILVIKLIVLLTFYFPFLWFTYYFILLKCSFFMLPYFLKGLLSIGVSIPSGVAAGILSLFIASIIAPIIGNVLFTALYMSARPIQSIYDTTIHFYHVLKDWYQTGNPPRWLMSYHSHWIRFIVRAFLFMSIALFSAVALKIIAAQWLLSLSWLWVTLLTLPLSIALYSALQIGVRLVYNIFKDWLLPQCPHMVLVIWHGFIPIRTMLRLIKYLLYQLGEFFETSGLVTRNLFNLYKIIFGMGLSLIEYNDEDQVFQNAYDFKGDVFDYYRDFFQHLRVTLRQPIHPAIERIIVLVLQLLPGMAIFICPLILWKWYFAYVVLGMFFFPSGVFMLLSGLVAIKPMWQTLVSSCSLLKDNIQTTIIAGVAAPLKLLQLVLRFTLIPFCWLMSHPFVLLARWREDSERDYRSYRAKYIEDINTYPEAYITPVRWLFQLSCNADIERCLAFLREGVLVSREKREWYHCDHNQHNSYIYSAILLSDEQRDTCLPAQLSWFKKIEICYYLLLFSDAVDDASAFERQVNQCLPYSMTHWH